MVHPLNELRELKTARTEVAKARKELKGTPVNTANMEAALGNLRAELREEFEAALAPVRAALEIDDLDHAIDELDGGPVDDEPQEDPEP